MRNVFRAVATALLACVAAHTTYAVESTWEYSVQVSAIVQPSPAQISLSWPQDTYMAPNSYTVYRKAPGATSWGSGTTLLGSATSYTDTNVTAATGYEYQLVKSTSLYTGYGYICAGINLPLAENRGKVLLVVDNTYAANLTNELARLQQDLVGDGWTVARLEVGRNDSVVSVKNLIKAQYHADPANVKAVFLFGHVPVPYSGDIIPDGHYPDHQGAWPCDGYYGDMDGTWTDGSVNDTSAADARNRNVPGDGKFDQSTFPAPLKLMVGRVDLANMPGRLNWGGPATFPSELELLRNYLNKDHNFRHKQFELPRRGIIGDYFGVRDGEAFAASGWRNFSTFFTAASETFLPNKGTWIPTLSSNAYLWAYGCGSGSYTSIGGLGNSDSYNDGITTEMVRNDIKAVFTLLFGSWLGDWDSEDDIMRSILALPSYGLTCAWSGRPHWYVQHMALGEPIGYSARLTQNNGPAGLYKNQLNSCAGQTHIALMGDPTLRMHSVAPPSNLQGVTNASGVNLSWTASADQVLGYHVYRASSPNGPFNRVTSSPVTGTSFEDNGSNGSFTYMVRAIKLESSASGTYFNPSQGSLLNLAGPSTGPVVSTDTNAPRVSMTAPNPNSTLSDSAVTVSAEVTDDTAVAGVQFKLDGANLGSEVNTAPYTTVWNTTTNVSGPHSLTAVGRDAAGNHATANAIGVVLANDSSPATNSSILVVTNNTVWVEDSLPAGAVPGADGGDAWTWAGSNPTPYSGGLGSQSTLGAGLHQHYFSSATSTLSVNTGEVLFAYVYLDPSNVPSELMLQWNSGSWEHRAYWGANRIAYSVDGTAGRRYIGALPAAGQWVRLEVPASQVGLEGSNLSGMAFTLFDGRATWDYAGKSSFSTTNSGGSTNSLPGGSTNVSWVDDSLPAGAVPGADGGDSWNWVASNPAPSSGSVANQSSLAAGIHQHFFLAASSTLPVNTGEVLFAYVYMDPSNIPSELMLQWNNGSWEHRAYWGANNINYGTDATASRRYIGALPAAGQWVRLEVAASQVGLEGSTLNGLAFTLFGGRATWDNAGKAATNTVTSSTNSVPGTNNVSGTNAVIVSLTGTNVPGLSVVDYCTLEVPKVGSSTLRVLTPTLLELKLINTKQPDPARVAQWDLVNANNQFSAPALSAFAVTANGQPVTVTAVGFKRRPLYAPLLGYDLRIENSLYLQVGASISDNQVIEVKNPGGAIWSTNMQFIATADPLRYSPAIHVNQEGYMPNYSKKAMVGYYAGSIGEVTIPSASGFRIVDANTGAQAYQGALTARPDVGWVYTATPYQKVYEADFTGFDTPGQYRLVVPGLGGSLPFQINDGIAMDFARAYALGLYHQRCGTNETLPYTRFTHDVCHAAPASVPMPASAFSYTWTTISNYALILNPDNASQSAPALTGPSAQLFPLIRQGAIDTTGGHHDAGDYSKYTANSASTIHYLMFAVDSLQGVGDLDNLGIPESGDGISDVLQEAKWEADFLAKIQDSDGGFYFLVYPQNREYEGNVMPDHGDPQVVWPKTTSVTAASVAALAQCASSPRFKQAYPATAALYLQKAQLGWQFLTNAIARYGKSGAYQKITHYADDFADKDELAWAACQMFLATGDADAHQKLRAWFDPADPATWRWGWWRLSQCYGHAIRSYAFAVQSGRIAFASQLDATFLSKCQAQIVAAGDDVLHWSQQSAYGTSFPEETKHVQGAGWYFSTDQAFDMTVAYQLNPSPEYLNALLANMNYEGGCNPVNVTYVTGLGWKRTRDVVSQYALNDRRQLAPSGIQVGNLQATFAYLWNYTSMLESLCFPSDGATTSPYPFYDRWGDSWNVSTEFVILNAARSLASIGFLAARGPLKTQPWRPVPAQIIVPSSVLPVGSPVTLSLQAPGMDLTGARIVWEARDQEPSFGPTFTFSPVNNGAQWVEAEAQWPDGRRVFAQAEFTANSPNIIWVDDAVPAGATSGADGGDSWSWMNSNPAPTSGALEHQSAIAAGSHQHYFYNATATLALGTGDVLYAWVYLDPNNRPSEVMLQWNNGSWEHRAYWGANGLGYGIDGTASRRYIAALPSAGQWVRLEVPATVVGLDGSTLNGMAFAAYGGRAAWDAAGRLSQTGPSNSVASVSVSATANASRIGLAPGTFTFTRTGDSSAGLTVNYSLSGTASSALDYQSPSPGLSAPSVTIPAGVASTTLNIIPLASTNLAAPKAIIVSLTNGSGYSIGTPASASIALAGNTVPGTGLRFSQLGATLSWPATVGRIYRVAYKNNLTDANWTVINYDILATENSISFTDTDAPRVRQRFYLAMQVN